MYVVMFYLYFIFGFSFGYLLDYSLDLLVCGMFYELFLFFPSKYFFCPPGLWLIVIFAL